MLMFAKRTLFLGLAACLLSSCKSAYEVPEWIGLTETEMKKKLGEPAFVNTLKVSSDTRFLEYQSGLYNHRPKNKSETVEIKEMQWPSFYKTTAVWFKADQSGVWKVIDTLGWYAWVSF